MRKSFILLLAVACAAGAATAAPNFNAALTTDLIIIQETAAPENGYTKLTWTAFNTTGASPGDPAVLSWSLIPFNVPAPLAWTAPDGWVWKNGGFELDKSPQKYYTPPALGPQQSAVFTYIYDPSAPILNAAPSVVDEYGSPLRAWLSHVGAVVPGSGLLDGDPAARLGKWEESYWTIDGKNVSTWFDKDPLRPAVVPIPEPATLALTGIGLAAVLRRRTAR